MTTNEMYQQLGISPEVLDFGQRVLDGLDKEMSRDDNCRYNQPKFSPPCTRIVSMPPTLTSPPATATTTRAGTIWSVSAT